MGWLPAGLTLALSCGGGRNPPPNKGGRVTQLSCSCVTPPETPRPTRGGGVTQLNWRGGYSTARTKWSWPYQIQLPPRQNLRPTRGGVTQLNCRCVPPPPDFAPNKGGVTQLNAQLPPQLNASVSPGREHPTPKTGSPRFPSVPAAYFSPPLVLACGLYSPKLEHSIRNLEMGGGGLPG